MANFEITYDFGESLNWKECFFGNDAELQSYIGTMHNDGCTNIRVNAYQG